MPRPRSNFSPQQIEIINKRVLEQSGVTLSHDTFGNTEVDLPEIKPFPLQVVLLNVFFDVLTFFSSIAALTGVGVAIPWGLRALVWVVNAFWFFGKVSPVERQIKRAVLRKLMLRIIAFFVTDMVPFNDILFPNSLMIVMVHYKETQVGKAIWEAVGEFHKEDIPKAIGNLINKTNEAVIRKARNRQREEASN